MKKTGIIQTYYDKENTILKEEYFQINEKKEGKYLKYHENGTLKLMCTYINDKNNGINEEYDEYNNLRHTYYMIDDKINGKMISYYANNKIYTEMNFINDKLNGQFIMYDTNNNIIYVAYYLDDNLYTGEAHEFYPCTKNKVLLLKCKYYLKNGKKEGLYTSYYRNGKVKEIYNYKDDIIVTI